MAPHSGTVAWKIPWTEEPGRLRSMGLLRVGRDWATSLSLSLSCIGEGNGNPFQCSCLENPRDGGAWWAAVYGVSQSRTRLKWLSSSSIAKPSIAWMWWQKKTFLEVTGFLLTPPCVSGHERHCRCFSKAYTILYVYTVKAVLNAALHFLCKLAGGLEQATVCLFFNWRN